MTTPKPPSEPVREVQLQKILEHTQAVRTRQRQALEEAEAQCAVPGRRVRIIRWPWSVGAQGTVMGVFERKGIFCATVDLDKRFHTIPLDALTTDMTTDLSAHLATDPQPLRRLQDTTRGIVPANSLPVIDCAQARMAAVAAWIRLNSGEHLD